MKIRAFARWARALSAGVVLTAAAAAFAQGIMAARVNGTLIPMEVVDRHFEEILRERRLHIARMQNPAKVKAIKREALDNLIRIELLWQEARNAGLAVSEEELQRAFSEARERARNAEVFERSVEQRGFTLAGYREHMRKMMSGDRYAQRVVERDVKITDQDVDDFYEVNPRLFKRAEQIKARQILVAVPANASPEQRAQARRTIDALLVRVRNGEDFEGLARLHSDDATRQWGGELDPFGRGEKAKPFEDAAFALVPGATSEVVETAAGLHLIKLEERTPAEVVPLETARERIREYLMRMRGKEAIDKEVEQLRALGKVELLTPM